MKSRLGGLIVLGVVAAPFAAASSAGGAQPERIASETKQVFIQTLQEDSKGDITFEASSADRAPIVNYQDGVVSGVIFPDNTEWVAKPIDPIPDNISEITAIHVIGWMEIVDQNMIDTWHEHNHPLDTWSEVPGDAALYVHIIMPVTNNLCPTYLEITIGMGEVDGVPASWEIGQQPRGSDAGMWHPYCCASQLVFCHLMNRLPLVGPFLCPRSHCWTCFRECKPGFPVKGDNPCHSCGRCGGSDLLCHIVPGGHC